MESPVLHISATNLLIVIDISKLFLIFLLLFIVVYSEDLNTFKEGELLRIPVTVGRNTAGGEGSLYTVRMATTDAVSQKCSETAFAVTVKSAEPLKGDINGDGVVNVGDIMVIINIMAGK